MFDLTGKVALVTGASSGMGRATAIALATQGAKVAVCARRLDRLTELVTEITSKGKEAIAIQMDVTKKDEVQKAITQAVTTYGKLDILVNNAGALDYSPFLEMTEEKWDLIIDTNLKGYFYAAQAAAKEMVKNNPPTGGGRIINIASIASGGVGVGMAQLVHYTASKGGVIGMTEALAVELGPYNILVNAIGPGGIDTEMTKGTDISTFANRLSVKRMGKPEEIAAAVVYFASDEAAYTTGTTLYVDGGWLAN
jgi:NAD(P)-dependent dehydrogenase (short-subunit alcohol dehydrogenase family)